jgi:chitin biosynthesis protein CHS5
VRPEWVEGCEREGRIVGVRGYYLDANPKDRQVGANPAMNAGSASRTSPAVSVPSGAGTGAGSQSSLPSRGTPKSAMKDSPVIGEPGPEVPPTPPPKHDNKAPPIASADEDEDDEEDEEDEEPAEKSEHESATTKEAEGSEARSSSHFYRRKSSAEDDEDGKGSTEMDEVPL